jgi:hypothetical protein
VAKTQQDPDTREAITVGLVGILKIVHGGERDFGVLNNIDQDPQLTKGSMRSGPPTTAGPTQRSAGPMPPVQRPGGGSQGWTPPGASQQQQQKQQRQKQQPSLSLSSSSSPPLSEKDRAMNQFQHILLAKMTADAREQAISEAMDSMTHWMSPADIQEFVAEHGFDLMTKGEVSNKFSETGDHREHARLEALRQRHALASSGPSQVSLGRKPLGSRGPRHHRRARARRAPGVSRGPGVTDADDHRGRGVGRPQPRAGPGVVLIGSERHRDAPRARAPAPVAVV